MTVNHDVTGSSPVRGAKKFQVYGLGIFLSKPQAWYIIRRKSVYHQRRLSAFASHHASACIFLRLDDIQHYVLMICNSFGLDDIHALRRDFMVSCNFVLRVHKDLVLYKVLFLLLGRARTVQWHQLNNHRLLRKLTVKGLPCGVVASTLPIFWNRLGIPTA